MAYFSNGAEGADFEEQWCSRCVHYDVNLGDDPPCPVWMAHLLYAYELCNEKEHPGKVMLDMLITERWEKASDGHGYPVQECAMFFPRDKGAAILGQTSLEVEA